MCCLMRVDYTVWLSAALHASHDNRVSVAPFNPITPTWSDTNSITPSFLSTHSFPFPLIFWYSFCHQWGFFIAWLVIGLAILFFLTFSLLLKPSLSFILPFPLLSWASAWKNWNLYNKRESAGPNLSSQPRALKKIVFLMALEEY